MGQGLAWPFHSPEDERLLDYQVCLFSVPVVIVLFKYYKEDARLRNAYWGKAALSAIALFVHAGYVEQWIIIADAIVNAICVTLAFLLACVLYHWHTGLALLLSICGMVTFGVLYLQKEKAFALALQGVATGAGLVLASVENTDSDNSLRSKLCPSCGSGDGITPSSNNALQSPGSPATDAVLRPGNVADFGW